MGKQEEYIAIYSRKSRYTEKGESIGNQVELCKAYICEHYGGDALEHTVIYEDEGFSGGNLNRPDFQKMMDDAKKRRFHAIVVYRLDRISRNISDFSGLIDELAHLDIAFVSIKEQFDTGTPMGRAMMYIASVFSQLERETIAERIRDNMHELAKTGRWLGGITPTGYASEEVKHISVDGKSRKVCRLRIIPEEAEVIKTIYNLYMETESQTTTEAELIKRGLKTKNNKYFTRFSIKSILQNPVYMIADQDAYNYFIKVKSDLFSDREAFDGVHGIMAYNRTCQEKGRTTEFRSPEEWIVAVGLHPGIIPGKIWVAVQESLECNKSKSYHRPRINEALLTGVLYCSCGSRMYPKLSQRKTPDGRQTYTYVCKMKERSRCTVCSSKNINGNITDMAVVHEIKTLTEDREAFVMQLRENRKIYAGEQINCRERLTALKKEKTDIEKKIEALVDSLAELGDSTVKIHVMKRLENLNEEWGKMGAHISELESLSLQNELSHMEFDDICQILKGFAEGIDELSVQQKRMVIRSIVHRVIWDGFNIHVVFFGVQDDEI